MRLLVEIEQIENSACYQIILLVLILSFFVIENAVGQSVNGPTASLNISSITANEPVVSNGNDFSYTNSGCPFDTVGLNIRNLQCGYLTVPENRKKNNGRTIKLAVAVIKAPKSKIKKSAVVVLTGGPGDRALSPRFLKLSDMLLPGRDVIVLDQRGAGSSKPNLCSWLDKSASDIRAMNLTGKQADLMIRGAIRGCHDELRAKGIDLGAYNVIENAADINDLRQALGYTKWNLAGGSYGGMLEQVEIRDFPAGVRSAVLFSPVPIGMLGGDNVSSFARSLDKVFKLCSSNKSCAETYPYLKKKFYATIDTLRLHPLKVYLKSGDNGTESYVVNSQDFVHLIFEMLYNENGISYFPATVNAFYSRDKKTVSKIISSGMGADYKISEGMFLSDVCYDAPASRSKWETEAAAHPDLKAIGFWNDACTYWEPEHATPAELRPVKSDIPVMVINGYLDPITPPEKIQIVLNGFSNARHVMLKDGTHSEPSVRTIGCLRLLVGKFLNNPSKKPDTACVTKISPLQFKSIEKN